MSTQTQIPNELLKRLRDPLWRINNLYYIKDKRGNKIQFKLNRVQQELFNDPHNQQIVLKARQQGITTYYAIKALDMCFWSKDGINAGIIAHRREDSELIFFDKVKYAYDHMPEYTKCFNQASNDSARELRFKNGSTFRVSTSMRGRTLQFLHISEFGKINKVNPSLAEEIVTGSLNAVESSQFVAIESTAEGKEGYFYDFCMKSKRMRDEGIELSPMDMRFFFFPWYLDPSYKTDTKGNFDAEQEEYFKTVPAKLSDEQKEWYIKKAYMLGEKMLQEYPSTVEESFMQSSEGYWYAEYMKRLKLNGRIGEVVHDPSHLVHMAFDLGVTDHTAIWFFQIINNVPHMINYYEDNNKAYDFYVRKIREIGQQEGYTYGRYFFPHDVRHKEQATGMERRDILESLGIPVDIVPSITIIDGIQAVRSRLPMCRFDEKKCKEGITHLETYKKKWSSSLGGYIDVPFKDVSSHGCDAFRYACLSFDKARDGTDDTSWKDIQRQWQNSAIGV